MPKYTITCKECDFYQEEWDYQLAEHVELNHINDFGHDKTSIIIDYKVINLGDV